MGWRGEAVHLRFVRCEDGGLAEAIQRALEQQLSDCCIGGHGTDPNEQKTQQSPGFGLSTAPQARQS